MNSNKLVDIEKVNVLKVGYVNIKPLYNGSGVHTYD